MGLTYELDLPPDARDGVPLIVLLHGRGSDRFDLLGLRDRLAPDALLVTPEAPFPAAPWGYGPGSAWYRFLGDDRPEPESFDRSQRELAEFLADLPGRLPVRPGPIALGGFSQGGTMSVAYALRNPGAVQLVLNFSGFLASHPTVRAVPETVAGKRFFWGHGHSDPAIPFALARSGWQILTAAGADLTTWDGPIGHWIAPEELEAAAGWLRSSVGQITARDGRSDERTAG